MAKKHQNSDGLNTVMGTILSVATNLKKKDILLNAQRIVPKKGKTEIVVFHKGKEISRFSEDHKDVSFDEMKKIIIGKLNSN